MYSDVWDVCSEPYTCPVAQIEGESPSLDYARVPLGIPMSLTVLFVQYTYFLAYPIVLGICLARYTHTVG